MRGPPSLAQFLASPIRVRAEAGGTPVEDLAIDDRARDALRQAGVHVVGDLQGRRGQDLNWLPKMASGQLRKLHRALVDRDLLEPVALPAMPVAGKATSTRRAPAKARPWKPRSAPPPPAPAPREPRKPPKPSLVVPIVSSRTAYAAEGPFRVAFIRIKPDKRDIPFERLLLSTWLENTLAFHHMTRFGDLDGRWVHELRRLRRFGRVQLRELHGALVAHDALDESQDHPPQGAVVTGTPPRIVPGPSGAQLLEHAPPYSAIRFERIAIRPEARARRFDEIPMPAQVRALVMGGRRETLGDLDGLTYSEVLGAARSRSTSMRQLHRLLRGQGVSEPRPACMMTVPEHLREVSIDDVGMPGMLRLALRARGVRRLGQLDTLTPARLGSKFAGERWKALLALQARLPTLRLDRRPVARALDRAIDQLSPLARRAILLRFGAVGRPLTMRAVLRRCKVRSRHPYDWFARWLVELRGAVGPGALEMLREIAGKTSRRSPMSVEEADACLRIAKSRPRYGREFYLRLARSLERGLRVKVEWAKRTR